MKSSLIINSADSGGKAQQKTLAFVNPDVDNSALESFAQKIVGLSTHQYVNSVRVDTSATSEEIPHGSSQVISKTQPNLSIGNWTKQEGDFHMRVEGQDEEIKCTFYTTQVTYNGDGSLSASVNVTHDAANIDGDSKLMFGIPADISSFSGVITASEGSNYAATQLAFNYTDYKGSGKPVPDLSIQDWITNEDNNLETSVYYTGDGTLYFFHPYSQDAISEYGFDIVEDNELVLGVEDASGVEYFYLFAPETDNFAAVSLKFSNPFNKQSDETPL